MSGIKDDQGHEWCVNIYDHPFLTGWKYKLCGKTTYTQDELIPADVPKLMTPCIDSK